MTHDLLDREATRTAAPALDSLASTATTAPTAPTANTVARYPHRQSLTDWLLDLARTEPATTQLLRALPLVDAHWSGPERLALHQRLWALWREVDPATRTAAAQQLDGRHALWCRHFAQGWERPATWAALAQAHLDWPSRRFEREAALAAPVSPDYVAALIDHHGVGDQPQGRWWRLCAGVQATPAALDPATAAQLGDEALAIVEAGGISGQAGLALLFELAVRSGDADRATEVLVHTVTAGGAEHVAPRWLRGWLEGPGDVIERPLALAAPLETTWLRPACLRDPEWRACLAGALRRAGPRARLQALDTALGATPSPTPPNDPAWKLLSALDGAYALAEADRLSEATATALHATALLAPEAATALRAELTRVQTLSAASTSPAHPADTRAPASAIPHTPLPPPLSPAPRWPAQWEVEGPGRPHLWVPPRGPANGEWLIVPSCLDSRNSYTQVDALTRALPGHQLVFVNNPEFNWYSDAVFEGLRTLVRERVLTQTPPARVSCWFGSMGGTAALKLALEFGLRAVVFNPQTDLDLWAAFRPGERERLWHAGRDAAPGEWPDAAWEQAPMYVACGSGTADRLGLQVLIERWRHLRCAHLIVEKFIDPVHAGLLKRVTPGPVPAMVLAACERLAQLRDAAVPSGAGPGQAGDPAGFVEIPAHRHGAFWDLLDADATLKTEIVLREGRLFLRASDRCTTR